MKKVTTLQLLKNHLEQIRDSSEAMQYHDHNEFADGYLRAMNRALAEIEKLERYDKEGGTE